MKMKQLIIFTATFLFFLAGAKNTQADEKARNRGSSRPIFERFHEELQGQERDRVEGRRPRGFSVQVREFLMKHSILIKTSYNKLNNYILQIANNPSEIRSFKEILKEATAKETPEKTKNTLNRLTRLLIELKHRDPNFKIKSYEVERATKEWSPAEVQELENIMRESLEALKDGKSGLVVLEEIFGKESAEELVKVCK